MKPRCATRPALDFHSDSPAVQEACKAICGGCELRVSCLAGAIARDEPAGVWGGESFNAVDEVTAALTGQPPAFVRVAIYAPKHGSHATYVAGCHCDECTAANTAYMAEQRQTAAWYPPPAPVVHETPPEQLDLFGPVTASEKMSV